MSDIVIRRSHGLSAERARQAANKIASDLDDSYDLTYQWQDNVLHFKRHGVSGHLSLTLHAVEIHVRLGFLLFPMRPHIESEIHRFFDENFGHESKTRI